MATVVHDGVPCLVCSKKLTNKFSVARGTGAVCAKNVMRFLNNLRTSEKAKTAWESWAKKGSIMRVKEVKDGNYIVERAEYENILMNGEKIPHLGRTESGDYILEPHEVANHNKNIRVGVFGMAISTAKSQFLARIRRQYDIPVTTGRVEETLSKSRGSIETINFERFDSGAVITHSRSGRDYVINTDRTGLHPIGCSCPDHQFSHKNCRHMEAYDRLSTALTNENAPLGSVVKFDNGIGMRETEIVEIIKNNNPKEIKKITSKNRLNAAPAIIQALEEHEHIQGKGIKSRFEDWIGRNFSRIKLPNGNKEQNNGFEPFTFEHTKYRESQKKIRENQKQFNDKHQNKINKVEKAKEVVSKLKGLQNKLSNFFASMHEK